MSVHSVPSNWCTRSDQGDLDPQLKGYRKIPERLESGRDILASTRTDIWDLAYQLPKKQHLDNNSQHGSHEARQSVSLKHVG